MYRVITGACSEGCKYFVKNTDIPKQDKYTVKQLVELTKGQYGNEELVKFLEK